VVMRLVGRLGPLCRPPGRRRATVILGAPSGELHGLPAHLFADVLRCSGYEVRDLGADTPAAAFLDALADVGDRAVAAVSVTTDAACADAAVLISALAVERRSLVLIVGGRAIVDDAHARALGADATATASSAPEVIESLLKRGQGTRDGGRS
jgi:methanogenic corrinoid protein MtbC1